jgi:hypothetical protein
MVLAESPVRNTWGRYKGVRALEMSRKSKFTKISGKLPSRRVLLIVQDANEQDKAQIPLPEDKDEKVAQG